MDHTVIPMESFLDRTSWLMRYPFLLCQIRCECLVA